jgi:RNA-directed DNA polymerase
MKIKLLGYPEHRTGNQIRIQEGSIVRQVNHSDNIRFEISSIIFGGNSGGPILNKSNQVIGVAVKGITSNGVVPPQIIPISEVLELFTSNQLTPSILV